MKRKVDRNNVSNYNLDFHNVTPPIQPLHQDIGTQWIHLFGSLLLGLGVPGAQRWPAHPQPHHYAGTLVRLSPLAISHLYSFQSSSHAPGKSASLRGKPSIDIRATSRSKTRCGFGQEADVTSCRSRIAGASSANIPFVNEYSQHACIIRRWSILLKANRSPRRSKHPLSS